MSRIRALAYAAMAMCLFAGVQGPDQTGVHVHVHLGSISYDELRFGVLEVGAATTTARRCCWSIPKAAGRRAGLSSGRDQDVVILLDDTVDGNEPSCATWRR